jgi:hypothetical protein
MSPHAHMQRTGRVWVRNGQRSADGRHVYSTAVPVQEKGGTWEKSRLEAWMQWPGPGPWPVPPGSGLQLETSLIKGPPGTLRPLAIVADRAGVSVRLAPMTGKPPGPGSPCRFLRGTGRTHCSLCPSKLVSGAFINCNHLVMLVPPSAECGSPGERPAESIICRRTKRLVSSL